MNNDDLPSETNPSNLLNPPMIVAVLFVIAIAAGIGEYLIRKVTSQPSPQLSARLSSLTPTIPQPTPDTWITYADLNHGFALKYPNKWSQAILRWNTNKIVLSPVVRDSYAAEDTIGYLPGLEITAWKVFCSDSAAYVQEELNRWLDLKRDMDKTYPEAYRYLVLRTLKLESVHGYVAEYGLPNQEGNPVEGGAPEAMIYNCPFKIHILFDYSGIQAGRKLFDKILSTIKVWTPKEYSPG